MISGKASPHSVSPQAKEHVEKSKEQHRREERENLAEMMHILTSDMMTERAEVAQTDLGGRMLHRVPVDRWKGMSSVQLGAIHREREEQRLERQVLVSKLLHTQRDQRFSKVGSHLSTSISL